MSILSIEQALIQQYHQFLGDLGQSICDKIYSDEGVQALKQMQDKEYLLQRVKQIIQSVYEIKNEQNNVSLYCQIEQQNNVIIKQEAEIRQFLHKVQNSQKILSIQTNNIKKHQGKHQGQEQKENQSSKMRQLKEYNFQLEKKLIQLTQESKLQVREFSQTIKLLQNQKYQLNKRFERDLSELIGNVRQWQQKYRQIYQKKNDLQGILQGQVQKLMQEKMKCGQYGHKIEQLQLRIKKSQTVNKNKRDEIDQLSDKLLRMQKSQQRLQQQVKSYRLENNVMKKINSINNKSTNQDSNIINQTTIEATKLRDELKKLQQDQIRHETLQKNKKILQLERKLQSIKSSKHQVQLQFHNHKLTAEKGRFQLQQELNQLRIKHQKQSRLVKVQYIKERQQLIKQHQSSLKSTEQIISNKYQQKISFLEQRIKQSEQNQKVIKIKQKQIQLTTKQKQANHNQLRCQLQKKNNQLRIHIKQLQKHLNQKHLTNGQYLKQYSMKVEACQQEVQHYKIQNKKLRNQLQSLRKQLQKSNLNRITEKHSSTLHNKDTKLNQYNRSDIEEYFKTINDLKQKNTLYQSEHKYLNKQIQSKSQLIEELKTTINKLSDKESKTLNKINKLQKQLSTAKQEITQLQANHHKELNDNYKIYENRIQTEKRQITNYYEELIKNRQQKLQETRNTTTLLENQSIINSLRNNQQTIRQKNQSLQHKNNSLTEELQQINKQLKQKQNKLEEVNQKNNNLQKQIFNQKNKYLLLTNQTKQKLKANQAMFRQFKFQIDQYLRNQLNKVKQINKQTLKMIIYIKNWFSQTKEQFTLQFYAISSDHQSKTSQTIKSLKSHYQHQIQITHKISIQQLQQSFNQKLKQQQIQNMSLLAEKQFKSKEIQKTLHSINSIKQKTYQKLTLTEQELLKTKQELNLIKNVNQIANQKNLKLQKLTIQQQRDLKQLKKQNQSLNHQLIYIEQTYQQKLQKCREKYILQNQKLFSKYQKQFDKLIGMNTKVKNVTLSSVMLSTVAPTKQYQIAQKYTSKYAQKQQKYTQKPQNHNQRAQKSKQFPKSDKSKQIHRRQKSKEIPTKHQKQSKLQNLKKQILVQKKKLQALDSTKNKLPNKPLKEYSSTSNLYLTKYK